MIETYSRLGKRVYRLIDPSGSFIEVAPEVGNSVIAFNVPYKDKLLNILYQPEDFIGKSGGIPFMWPFANRIKKGRFYRNNRDHSILGIPNTTDDKSGNAIHGMVRKAPWEIIDSGSSTHGVFISSRITTKQVPEIEKYFGQGIVTLTYTLCGAQLTVCAEIQNTGEQIFPMSWAFHPWFKIPLTENGIRNDVTIQIPATKRWETKNSIPTGNLLDVQDEFDLSQGKTLQNLEFDDVFTGLTFGHETGQPVSISRISDPHSGIDITVMSDSMYKQLVLFAPLNKPTVCIEPQTSPTNAFNMSDEISHLIVLEPGKKTKAEFKISVSMSRESQNV